MMYACRNRSKAIRRWLTLNQGAGDFLARRDGGHNAGEDRIWWAVLRRVVEGSIRRGADGASDRPEDHLAQASAAISAQRNPASSRPMAAATTERTFL